MFQMPTTHWSMIEAAKGRDPNATRDAYERFFASYHVCLLHYAKSRFSHVDVPTLEHILGDFVANEFETRAIMTHVNSGKGMFRQYVLRSMYHYFIRAFGKRGVRDYGVTVADVDDPAAHSITQAETAWAVALLNRTISLAHDHCVNQGRPEIWHVFKARVLNDLLYGQGVQDYTVLAEKLGLDVQRVRLYLATGKRIFNRMLRAAVMEYTSEAQVDEELHALRQLASRAPAGWFSTFKVQVP